MANSNVFKNIYNLFVKHLGEIPPIYRSVEAEYRSKLRAAKTIEANPNCATKLSIL